MLQMIVAGVILLAVLIYIFSGVAEEDEKGIEEQKSEDSVSNTKSTV